MSLLNQFEVALNHIDHHLDKPLDIGQLSTLINFPQSQFALAFKALFHTDIESYVSLLRLLDTAQKLAFEPEKTVDKIAKQIGYDNSDEFERAFIDAIGQSVADFRHKPDWNNFFSRQQPLSTLSKGVNTEHDFSRDVQLVEFEAMQLIAIRHQGAKRYLSQSIKAIDAWQLQNQLSPLQSRRFSLVRTFSIEADEQVDIEIAVTVNNTLFAKLTPDGVQSTYFYPLEIPHCKMLQLTHEGDEKGLEEKIAFLYRVYLDRENYQLLDIPLIYEQDITTNTEKAHLKILLAVR